VKRLIDPYTPSEGQTNRKRLPIWVMLAAGVILLSFLVLLVLGLQKNSLQTLTLGSKAADFNLTTFDGSMVTLKSLQGKTVLINFWASWCTTCIDEAAILQEGWQKVGPGGQIVFLGVDYADTEPAARAFLQKYAVSYLNGPDLRSALSQQFHVSGVPETYLIDAEGVLRGIKIGPFTSAEELSAFLEQKSGN
jgi:cytochrome c biogenesis protein CcmG, thiol:disulfide interchange protein DsbE